MVATTTLMDYERNKSSMDYDIDTIIDEARRVSGKDWQVTINVHRERRMFRKERVSRHWQLLVHVGGCLPYQVITCAYDRDTVFAYLAGVVSGALSMAQGEGAQVIAIDESEGGEQ